jgi:hypothetical protein
MRNAIKVTAVSRPIKPSERSSERSPRGQTNLSAVDEAAMKDGINKIIFALRDAIRALALLLFG